MQQGGGFFDGAESLYFYGAPGEGFVDDDVAEPAARGAHVVGHTPPSLPPTVSYAGVCGGPSSHTEAASTAPQEAKALEPQVQWMAPPPPLCRWYLRGECRFGDYCRYSHDLPDDDEVHDEGQFPPIANGGAVNEKHSCGICMDEINPRVRKRYGILPGCAHVFCLDCIRYV